MYGVLTHLNAGSRSISFFLGMLALGLASAVLITGYTVDDLAEWTLKMFGASFLFLISTLVIVVCFCWVRMCETKHLDHERQVWTEIAQHAANGTATLALTYTLLGISLGINTLANQELNSDTVQKLISSLTEHFSLAFMTTVVGLPISAILRALISITEAKLKAAGIHRHLSLSYTEGDKS